MLAEVRAAFVPFTDPLEGVCPYLYTDAYGLVTTGRGNLVDWGPRRMLHSDAIGTCDPSPALALGWKNADGSLSTAQIIRTAWWAVKNAWPFVQSTACVSLTTIRLDETDVNALTFHKLDELWAQLARRWPDIDSWPACAQLGVASMAWAMGASFQFPKFEAAADVRDWRTCAAECRMVNGSSARNARTKNLFMGALTNETIDEALEVTLS